MLYGKVYYSIINIIVTINVTVTIYLTILINTHCGVRLCYYDVAIPFLTWIHVHSFPKSTLI